MSCFQLSILVALVMTLTVGLLVYFAQPKRSINRAFLVLSGTLIAWFTGLAQASLAGTLEETMFWIRQSSALAVLIPLAVYALRLVIVYPGIPPRRLVNSLLPPLLLAGLAALLCQTRWFLVSAVLPESPGDIAKPIYSGGFLLYLAYYLLAVTALLGLFVMDLRHSTGIRRIELQFTLLGSLGGIFLGALLAALAAASSPEIRKLGQLMPLSVLVFNIAVAYGVATRSILEVPDVLRRLVAAAGLAIYLATVYVGVWGAIHWGLGRWVPGWRPLAPFWAAIAVAYALSRTQGQWRQLGARLFPFPAAMDAGSVLREAGRMFNAITTVDDLLAQVLDLLQQRLQVGELRVLLLLQEGQYQQRAAWPPQARALRLDQHHPLAAALKHRDELLVGDMIQRMKPTPELEQARQYMQEHGIAAAAGIHTKGSLTGILLLGCRTTARIYGVVEQSILNTICNQLSVALENAQLYTEVQNSRLYTTTLLDNLLSGVVAADNHRVLTICNQEAARILDWPAPLRQTLFVWHLPEPLYTLMEEAFNARREIRDRLVILPGEHGQEHYLQAGAAVFHNQAGIPLGALLVFNDVTETKRLEQQVRRTDRLASIGTLSAGMAHEIKNPLVTLKTFSQLLPERYDDPDFRQTFSALAGQEVQRIDGIVNQLLRFAKPAPPRLAIISLHALLHKTMRLVAESSKQKGIACHMQLDAPQDDIRGDDDLLVQAFLNIFLNAVDAMDTGGMLEIRSRLYMPPNGPDDHARQNSPGWLEVLVSDTGRGIAQADIPHIFDPFFTTKDAGTGLGLSVAHRIFHEHNVQVEVQSRLGEGTTFRLLIERAGQETPI